MDKLLLQIIGELVALVVGLAFVIVFVNIKISKDARKERKKLADKWSSIVELNEALYEKRIQEKREL